VIVNYTKTFLTNTVTGEQISGQVREAGPIAYAVRGEVRGYVGGRQRSIGRTGTSATWSIPMVELTAAQVATLEGWMSTGITVFARNHLGESMYGTFFAVETQPVKAADPLGAAYAVTLEIRMVDVVEGV
jgi:hypothetical protein